MARTLLLVAVVVLTILGICALPARARSGLYGPPRVETPASELLEPRRENVVIWFDDIESGVNGWTHGDATAAIPTHFHVDTYLSHPGGSYSYWCGVMDPTFAGGDGYGNSWDQRLDLPPVHLVTTAVERVSWGSLKAMYKEGEPADETRVERATVYPVFTFAYRYDSEPGYDYTWVQADSFGSWKNLNSGYDGSSGGWQDYGDYGFDMFHYGDPLILRFRFISDGAWSDEDGLFDSDGGAFHVDNIRVFDFMSGEVFFYDDCEDEIGLCTPSVPAAAGDWWHIIDRRCPALSDPHSWWCGDDSDTSLIPPGLSNWLKTPVIDLPSHVISCTCHFAMHFAVPTIDNDYVAYYGTCDGENYYSFGGWWGDFGQCDGWGSTPYNVGFDVGQFCPGWSLDYAGFMFVFHTSDNGCGPGGGGDAGVMVDDLWFEGTYG